VVHTVLHASAGGGACTAQRLHSMYRYGGGVVPTVGRTGGAPTKKEKKKNRNQINEVESSLLSSGSGSLLLFRCKLKYGNSACAFTDGKYAPLLSHRIEFHGMAVL
jgi:hypothetical protein